MVLVRKYSKRKIHDVSIHLPKKKEFAVRGGGGGAGDAGRFPLGSHTMAGESWALPRARWESWLWSFQGARQQVIRLSKVYANQIVP